MTENLFELRHVNYEVDQYEIFSDLNLKVYPGDFIRIVGPSGSGKSTFMKLIASLINPTSGEILYKGEPLLEQDLLKYRQKVSYFFQNPRLFGKTVRENLEFPYKVRGKNFEQDLAIELLKKVNLNENYLDKSINDLSGGEAQRIAFVRNMLMDPEVLLLDEVTSSLDSTNRKQIISWVDELNKEGKTVFWITHFEENISENQKTLVIADGKAEFANGSATN